VRVGLGALIYIRWRLGAMQKIVYPLYLVIDSSSSMNKEVEGQRRIDLAREIPLALLKLYEDDNSLVSSVQVSVITFNTEARCMIELGEISNLRELPSFEAKSKTFFSAAFRELRARISEDYARLSGDRVFMKPAVVMVTDGRPNDDASERTSSFRQLVPMEKYGPGSSMAGDVPIPQRFMLGIDVAHPEVLEAYASDPALARKVDGALSVGEQIRWIAKLIQGSVSTSMANPVLKPDEDWLRWFETEDDDDPDFGNFF
jgi:hypothetical protein